MPRRAVDSTKAATAPMTTRSRSRIPTETQLEPASSEPEPPRPLKRKARTPARPKKRQDTTTADNDDAMHTHDQSSVTTARGRKKVKTVRKAKATDTNNLVPTYTNMKETKTKKVTKTKKGAKEQKTPKVKKPAATNAIAKQNTSKTNVHNAHLVSLGDMPDDETVPNETNSRNEAAAGELVHTKWFRAMARKLAYMLAGGALAGSAAYKAAALWGYVKASEAAKHAALMAEKQELYRKAQIFMDMATSGAAESTALGVSLPSQDPRLAFEKGRQFLGMAHAHEAPAVAALTTPAAVGAPALSSLLGSLWSSVTTSKAGAAKRAAARSSSLVSSLMPTMQMLRSENLTTVAKWVALVITTVLSMRWLGNQLWKLTWGHGASALKQEADEHAAFVHDSRQHVQRTTGAAHEVAHNSNMTVLNAHAQLANLAKKQENALKTPLVPLRQVFATLDGANNALSKMKKQAQNRQAWGQTIKESEASERARINAEVAATPAPELVRRARHLYDENTNARMKRFTKTRKLANRSGSDSNGENVYSFWTTPP